MNNLFNRIYYLGAGLVGVMWAATLLWAAEPTRSSVAVQPFDWVSGVFSRHGLGVGLLAVFVGGLALNLTPCVYPMIPVTLAFFSNQASGSLPRVLLLATLYVIGISLSYATLGFLAVQTGSLLGSWLQQPAVLVLVACVIGILSLSLFGVYAFRIPQALSGRLTKAWTGIGGAFLMGLVVGLVAAPCVGPFVLGLMLFVSRLGQPGTGILLFFVLGLGMGLPYIFLAVVANKVGRFPKAGEWLVWSKKILGCVLLGLALYFLRPLLSASLMKVAGVSLLVGTGIYLGWLDGSVSQHPLLRRVKHILGAVLLGAAIASAWPKSLPDKGSSQVRWIPFDRVVFERTLNEQRPMIIDVYADWCLPCVEMDHVTLKHPDVVKALVSVATLRVDATREVSQDAGVLFERYDVFGVPTVLFFDRAGKERRELRLLGFVPPDEFLKRLRQIQ